MIFCKGGLYCLSLFSKFFYFVAFHNDTSVISVAESPVMHSSKQSFVIVINDFMSFLSALLKLFYQKGSSLTAIYALISDFQLLAFLFIMGNWNEKQDYNKLLIQLSQTEF